MLVLGYHSSLLMLSGHVQEIDRYLYSSHVEATTNNFLTFSTSFSHETMLCNHHRNKHALSSPSSLSGALEAEFWSLGWLLQFLFLSSVAESHTHSRQPECFTSSPGNIFENHIQVDGAAFNHFYVCGLWFSYHWVWNDWISDNQKELERI